MTIPLKLDDKDGQFERVKTCFFLRRDTAKHCLRCSVTGNGIKTTDSCLTPVSSQCKVYTKAWKDLEKAQADFNVIRRAEQFVKYGTTGDEDS